MAIEHFGNKLRAEGFGRAEAANGQDRKGQQDVPLGALKDRFDPAFAANGDGPVRRPRRRNIDARIGVGRGYHNGNQQRGHKTSQAALPLCGRYRGGAVYGYARLVYFRRGCSSP